jgi:hypothetical protein
MRHVVAAPATVAVQVEGVEAAPDSLNPNEVEPPAGICAFHASFVNVSLPLLALAIAFHGATLVPCHGIVTLQPLTAVAPRLRTTTDMVRPLPQSDVTLYVTEIRALLDGKVCVGVGVGVGATVGVTTGAGVAVGVAAPVTRSAQ